MRRFIIFAALLGLTACGGEVLPEEEHAAPAQEEVSGGVSAQGPVLCSGSDPACCSQYTDYTKCTMNSYGMCYWSADQRCVRK